MPNSYNKIIFTPDQIAFLKNNYQTMTNQQLANVLNMKLTRVRNELYSLGLKRMELEYWTQEQIDFLKANYKKMGDTELAESFAKKWQKQKGWTKKHIEKKRRYLKLKRTSAQKKAIHKRNTELGCFKICNQKMWEKRGVTPIGEKRIWFRVDLTPFVVIKTENGFQNYNTWLWEKEKGPIPPGMNVVIIGNDKINFTINDLKLISNAELLKLNQQNSVPVELRESINIIKQINKLILTS